MRKLKLSALIFGSLLIVAGVWYLQSPKKVEATFSGYADQRTLTVINASSTQSSFPVLICFNSTQGNGNVCPTATDLKASSSGGSILTLNASSTPNDLVFSTSTTATGFLPFEIENYASTTGELEAWVNMPTVANGQVIYMYYGKSADTNHQNVSGTWNSNYTAVYHLPNGTTLTANDSTNNGRNGTLQNTPTAATGQIDGAANFLAASSQSITTPTLSATTTISFSTWFKSVGSPSTSVLLNTNYNGFSVPFMLCLGSCGGAYNGMAYYDGGWNSSGGGSAGTTLNNNWHYIVGTNDGATIKLYVDGVLNSSGGNSGTLIANTNTLDIGRYLNDATYANGIEDEVHVYNGTLSSSWQATEYNNQSNDNTFWTTSGASTGVLSQFTSTNISTGALNMNNGAVNFGN